MTSSVDMLSEISNFIFTSKYARYLPDLKRRETWEEAVFRVESMHLKKFKDLDLEYLEEIRWAFDFVRAKRVVPSMRSMQFGGPAIEAHNAKLYNCAVRHVDSIRSFAEIFYLLLCGCGVGLGLTQKYLDRLPNLVGPQDKTGTVITYVIEDNIEGWADSVEALLNCYFVNTAYSGRRVIFDYSKIRKEGTLLKTGGGKAPGYKGLKAAHIKIKALMDHIIETEHQTRLKSINAYDICMHESDAVLSGGVRRSAMSVMFDITDIDMLLSKTGNWFEDNPQRARSNNSVRLLRNYTDISMFRDTIQHTIEWGEPGFVFCDSEDVLYNPCFEVGFIPVTDDGICGVQFCNLSSINGSKISSELEFYDAAKAAAIIGTLQATYTHFPYLSNTAKKLTEQEALLGVSITAMMDNPDILFNEEIQVAGASIVNSTNQRWARILNINPAARSCVIKPEGTSTLALGSMASGCHASHAKKMLRRIQVNKLDNVYGLFKAFNSHMTEESVWSANKTDDIIAFPVELPDHVITKKDLNALKHLELIKLTQQNWIQTGTTQYNQKPITHNVSCTVIVKDDEWTDVTNYLFDNRNYFSAVSLISDSGDKDYVQAPNEEMITDEDNWKFDYYMKNYIPIDYTLLREEEDGTSLMQEFSCAGGQCEVK